MRRVVREDDITVFEGFPTSIPFDFDHEELHDSITLIAVTQDDNIVIKQPSEPKEDFYARV